MSLPHLRKRINQHRDALEPDRVAHPQDNRRIGGQAQAGTQPFRFFDRKGEGRVSNVRWHKPLVAIIDAGTRSGLEVFAYDLKAKGIPLVGVRTAGALLGGRGYLLPDDSLLELAVAGVEVNGEKIEGKGVEPEVVVPFDVRYADGHDPQRDAAVTKALSLLSEG